MNNLNTKHILINSKILSHSKKKVYLARGEGCLSCKKYKANFVLRWKSVKVKAYDFLLKKNKIFTFSDYASIVFQHEYDHTQGTLIIDKFIEKKQLNRNFFKKYESI